MLRVENVKVYDLKESVIACRNSMRLGTKKDSFFNLTRKY